jgi:hypothetical protein
MGRHILLKEGYMYAFGAHSSCQILSPWLGDRVDSRIGLSYRPARLHRSTGLYIVQPNARVDYILQPGAKNLATRFGTRWKFWSLPLLSNVFMKTRSWPKHLMELLKIMIKSNKWNVPRDTYSILYEANYFPDRWNWTIVTNAWMIYSLSRQTAMVMYIQLFTRYLFCCAIFIYLFIIIILYLVYE